MRSLIVSLAFMAAITVPAVADDATSTPPQTPPPSVTPQSAGQTGATADQTTSADAVVCKKLPPPTGTRLGARTVCMTQKQWDDQTSQSQRALEGMQRKNIPNGGGGG